MTGNLALAASAAWLLAFVICLILADAPARIAGRVGSRRSVATQRPALVNLAATRCRLNGAAYAATVLDLAARRYIDATERAPGRLWCTVRHEPNPEGDLVASERAVLRSVSARTLTGGAPFEALTESCTADVRGTWHPFEEAVRAEGREAGLTRHRLPAIAVVPLFAGAAGLSALTFFALHPNPHGGLASPLGAAFFAFAIPGGLLFAFSLQDRLTRAGAALAAASRRQAVAGLPPGGLSPGGGPSRASSTAWPAGTAGLGGLAQAVAAGLPVPLAGASPGVHTGVRPGGRRAVSASELADNDRPKAAWSSLGGEWRLVEIGKEESSLMGRGMTRFFLGLGAAVLCVPVSYLGNPTRLLIELGLIAVAVVLVCWGVATIAEAARLPGEKAFRGQVIARWIEERSSGDDNVHVPCVAIDDCERCWTFALERAKFDLLSVGTEVNVRVSPRKAKLLSLEPDPDTARPAGADPRFADEPAEPEEASEPSGLAAEPLPLTAAEVADALGSEVRVFRIKNRRGTMVSYRGSGVSLTLGVSDTRGGFAGAVPPRHGGRPLPGVGDRAWALDEGRTIVGQVGATFLRLKLRGRAADRAIGPLPGLAAIAASRLAAQHALP